MAEKAHQAPTLRAKVLRTTPSAGAARCRRKFLRYFPAGFRDQTYLAWERDYKEAAHRRWSEELGDKELRELLRARDYREIAKRAVAIEARTNLLFSFEKMALRDALNVPSGARNFALGLDRFLNGTRPLGARFDEWCDVVGGLPRRQTRVLTWPVVTVFGFLARPAAHMFFKPNVTRLAARAYGIDFEYTSRPSYAGYTQLIAFAQRVRRDLVALRPRDMIDAQSFIWVQGSDEYPD